MVIVGMVLIINNWRIKALFIIYTQHARLVLVVFDGPSPSRLATLVCKNDNKRPYKPITTSGSVTYFIPCHTIWILPTRNERAESVDSIPYE
jgi:hypothetical protein